MSDFKRIGDISKIRRGASPRPIDDPKWFASSGVGWVRIVDVTRSKRYLKSTKQSLSSLGESKSVRVDHGDLIMTICATIGRPVIVQMAACIHDGFVQFYDIDGARTEYLYYALQFAEQEFKGMGQTGTQANLNTTIVGEHTIFCPPLPEQKKIARILTTVDNLIEQTEALIEKYKSIKQGMMHDLFTRGVDSTGKLRPPYEQAPHLYKKSPLGWIPKEWECVKTDDHLSRIEQGWSPDCESDPAGIGEWGVLKTTAVVWEGYCDDANKRLPSHLSPRCEYEVRSGDVLMTRGGPNSRVGVVSFVESTHGKRMMSDKLYRLVPHKSLSSKFLSLALSSAHTQTHLSTLKTGLAESQTNISQAIVRRLMIPLPLVDEQHSIEGLVTNIQTFIHRHHEELSKLSTLKTGLMQDLLTGKVRVNVDEADKELTNA